MALSVNYPFLLPPWRVDPPISAGVFLDYVAVPTSQSWTGLPPLASDQPNLPIIWTPDGYAPWNVGGSQPYVVGSGAQAGPGWPIRRPRIVAITGTDAISLFAPGDLQSICDQGDLILIQEHPYNDDHRIMAGLPNHAETSVSLMNPSFPLLVAIVGTCDPTKFTGGDFYSVYYVNGNFNSTWANPANNLSDFFAAVAANMVGAASAFTNFGRLNLAGPTLTGGGAATALSNYNLLMTALGAYGTSQNVASDAAAKTAILNGITAFFGL